MSDPKDEREALARLRTYRLVDRLPSAGYSQGDSAAPEPVAPGMTDLMVSPESIDAYMEANPLPPEPAAPVDVSETASGDTQADLMRAGDTQAVSPVVTAREIAERINRDARERLIRLAEYDTVDMGECLIRQFVDAALRAQVAAQAAIIADARAALGECAADLAAMVEATYPPESRTYPSEERRYQRDMEPVLHARHALARIDTLWDSAIVKMGET